MSNRYCIIMAGGIGSRFWPLSKNNYPKQFLDILGTGKSFIRSTFERFLPVVPAENFLVVTNAAYKELVLQHLPELSPDQVLCEPMRRNTAPCIAYANYRILSRCPEASIVVTPADHLVTNEVEFQRIIRVGMDFVENPAHTDALLTIGIRPSRPETGYGYIEANLSSPSLRNKEIFRVDSFREKPDLSTAKKYISKKNYFWNAGIFIWNVSTIVNAFRIYQPAMAKIFENLMPVYGTSDEQARIDELFPECDNISVDYAIMEKAEEIFVCPADFGWSDLGTWGSLQQQSKKDLYGNACIGQDISLFETHNCMIHTTQEKKVVIQGLDGYIVAETNDTLLICKLSEEQRIKQFSGQG